MLLRLAVVFGLFMYWCSSCGGYLPLVYFEFVWLFTLVGWIVKLLVLVIVGLLLCCFWCVWELFVI